MQMRRTSCRTTLAWVGALAGTLAGAAAAYTLVVRPRLLRWGSDQREAERGMPGDQLVPRARMESTRAVTIHAPASTVWAWLVQIGEGRGGYYSYDWLENAAGLDIHSADRILPELQRLQVGDTIRTDPGGGFAVAELEPARRLVLRARIDAFSGRHLALDAPLQGAQLDTSWAFDLRALDPHTTRLTARFRAACLPRPANLAFAYLLLEPAVFIMERRMLLGIKERAEAK